MPWADKVDEWLSSDVTKSFFRDIEEDIHKLTQQLVNEDDSSELYRLQGMVRALQGVLGMPDDGIIEHTEE